MSTEETPGYSELVSGEVDAIRIMNVAPPKLCDDVMQAMREVPFDWYNKSRVVPPIARFGPTLNDFRESGVLRSDYWGAMTEAVARSKTVPSLVEIHSIALARLGKVIGTSLRSATIDGKAVYCGTVREMPDGARVHFDNVETEFEGNLLDQQFARQLSFVVYLSVPLTGGETVIWERGPVATDEAERMGYGYGEDVVANLASVKFRPVVGQGILFRCDRLHAVNPSAGGRRVSMNFFVGVAPGKTAIVWS